MKALISPNEPRAHEYISGYETDEAGKVRAVRVLIEGCARVADVSPQEFSVAPPLFWVDCPENTAADLWAYKDGVVFELPQSVSPPTTSVQDI
jgi:hypothetical protein